ncbi:PQQ-binding-like beta-propeller repeat protein [Sandaracinus amylolyticus]|nr:PQQ-binding-like beta-propeller repeat protein [Sandaracinus amylolyticus]
MTASRWMGAIAIALVGCGGSQGLAVDFPDDRPDDVRAVLDRVAAAPPRQEPEIVVGLTPAPMRLWAYDAAAGRALWEQTVEAETTPQVAGDYVVTQEPSGIVVRRLSDGSVATRFGDDELSMTGADGEGALAAIALSTGGAVGARSRLVVVSNGGVAWQLGVEQAVGEPAVRAGMIFLPWAQQNLSVLDASGAELARVRFTRGVVGHALADERAIFFGQQGLAQLSERTTSAPDAPWFQPVARELPGNPGLLRNAYEPPPSPTSATHRVRLVWRAVPRDGDVSLQDDTIYFVSYRLVFALGASNESVRWVQQLPADVVGARAAEGGVFVVDDAGNVYGLSREDGRIVSRAQTGMAATWAHVSNVALRGGAPEGDAMPLRDQLLAATQNTDARLVPARAYAARLLASMPEPDVTASLVALCDDRSLPAQLHAAACDALAMRESGIEHVTSALERHASYLAGTSAPPVGPLARAAARANERRAVPLLIAQLRDPQTPAEDLAAVAEALQALGDASAREPLEDFVRLYHAENDETLGRALAAAITAYAALAGPASQDTLRWVIDDPMSMQAARAAAQQALTALSAAPASEPTRSAPTSEAATTSEETTTELPARITGPLLDQLMAPIDDDLDACLTTPERSHTQARVVIAVEPDGTITTVTATPSELAPCLEPVVRSRQFPATRARARQSVTYTVRR